MDNDQQIDIQSRHFRIQYQKLNTKVLKFIKILTFNVIDDDISCIVESRSLSLEYLSLKKLKNVYEEFLKSFPTTLNEDMAILRKERKDLTIRQYFAVLYRSEQKRILINQIKLVNITIHILERMMKGMTLDFAVTRIFELESKQDVIIHRKMIDSYLKSLKKGLDKNKGDYLQYNKISEADMLEENYQKRWVEHANSKDLRQFEVKGYDAMLSRILDVPLKSSKENNNTELQ